MAELAVRSDATAPQSAPAALVEWANAASAAHQLARPLCQTEFVPQHFRGNEQAATAAILYGAEAGLSPLQALQGIYVISGRPAMYARTMLAITLSAGHEVWTEDSTDSRVIVCGRRRGSSQVERVVWTLDRAKRAGYTKNAKYNSDPQAMLKARADSDICRRIAPDALLGMAYSAEELQDEEAATVTTAAPVTKTNETRRTARRAASPSLPSQAEEPDLDESPAAPAETGEVITAAQLKKLHAALGNVGLSDRDAGLEYLTEQVGREITTSKDLTKDEASRVIDRLEQSINPTEPDEPSWPDTPPIPA